MFDFTQLLDILRSPQVVSFVATYAATKGLDGFLNAIGSKDSMEHLLIDCLEMALSDTCKDFAFIGAIRKGCR